jgi:hypothetical protein
LPFLELVNGQKAFYAKGRDLFSWNNNVNTILTFSQFADEKRLHQDDSQKS